MATSSNILTLLKYNASKQKNGMLDYQDFCEYVHRYAQHHLEENSDLVVFCGTDFKEPVEVEINKLVDERQVVIGSIRNKEYIFVVPYYIERYASIYTQCETNFTVTFPNINELPKAVPTEITTRKNADDFFYSKLEKDEVSDKYLYSVTFSKNLPALLLPSSVSMSLLISVVLKKIQNFLHKEESHDYFLKKLTISNPGKELSIKNFFSQFMSNAQASLESLKTNGDNFYYWNQLFYFIKQDYTKLKDFTPEDITILQSVAIIELVINYYKSKAAERIQKEAAFKQLDTLMKNPPYYYSMDDVVKMKDKNGIPLLGQYKEDELKEHLKALSSESIGNQLPELLIFRVNDETGYYICKDRVMPLIIRLCNDVRLVVRESLIKIWYRHLLEYDTLREMKENAAFEICLERELKSADPILYALLTSSFAPVISFEDQTPGHVVLFRDGSLVPFSEILMISRAEILSDAKLKLPFWYTFPIVSFIMKLLFRKPKPKVKKQRPTAVEKIHEEIKQEEQELFRKRDADDSVDTKLSRRRELRKAAMEIEKQFVPESSTLDRELKSYVHEWNDRIGKQNYENLTEDVNSLIRDYFRKTLRTLKAESFTAERISSLAESLVDTPSMMKIKNHPALKRYAELYIIKIVKNLPSN